MNDGRGSTFRSAGWSSIIDLSFASNGFVPRTKWKLTEDFTNSDHQAIVMTVTGRNTRGDGLPKFTGLKWKDSRFDGETYSLMLSSFHTTGSTVEELVSGVYSVMLLCLGGRSPCYWWNDEIRNLERRAQLTWGRPTWGAERASYKNLRHQLRRAIKRSKKLSFQRICQEAEVNPFGKAYRAVRKRTGAWKQPN